MLPSCNLYMCTLGLISCLSHWSLNIFMIHNSIVSMGYSEASGSRETGSNSIHNPYVGQRVMHLLPPPFDHDADASLTCSSSRMWCHSLISSTKRCRWTGLFISSLESDSCHVCCSISHVFHPPPWQWLMTLSCRVLPRWLSHLSSSFSLHSVSQEEGLKWENIAKKTIDATCSQWEEKVLVNTENERNPGYSQTWISVHPCQINERNVSGLC